MASLARKGCFMVSRHACRFKNVQAGSHAWPERPITCFGTSKHATTSIAAPASHSPSTCLELMVTHALGPEGQARSSTAVHACDQHEEVMQEEYTAQRHTAQRYTSPGGHAIGNNVKKQAHPHPHAHAHAHLHAHARA